MLSMTRAEKRSSCMVSASSRYDRMSLSLDFALGLGEITNVVKGLPNVSDVLSDVISDIISVRASTAGTKAISRESFFMSLSICAEGSFSSDQVWVAPGDIGSASLSMFCPPVSSSATGSFACPAGVCMCTIFPLSSASILRGVLLCPMPP